MSENYRDVIQDDASLAKFLRKMAEFDRLFCDMMACGDDYTIKLELHGNAGELIHTRVSLDSFSRPAGVEARVDRKLSVKRA